MLAESALCLAFDDNPPSAGCVTTAVAMGDRLIDRLVKAGIRLRCSRTPRSDPLAVGGAPPGCPGSSP